MSDLLLNNTTNPGTPAASKLKLWANSTTKRLNFTDDAGVTGQVGGIQSWYNVQDYGVSNNNTASANVTALNNLLQNIAPDGSTIYFPAASSTYQFNAGLTTLVNDFIFRGARGMSQISFVANFAGSFITLGNTGFYCAFYDLSFINFVTQTAGAVVTTQNNVNVLFQDCFMTGSAAATFNNLIDFTGTNSGNGAVIRNLYANGWSGIAINVASPLDTIYMSDLELLGTAGAQVATAGIACSNGGAIVMADCQIIRCNTNISLAPTNGLTVSAIFATNCFFDQGVVNCLRITGSGTGTVARSHFDGCWFTVSSGGTNPNCIQVDSSGTGIHAGIEFQDCWIMNATPGSTGTLQGVVATAVQDITISNSQLAGWTNDIVLTPASAGTLAPIIMGNTMAAAGLIAASTTNIILNAGSFTYGPTNIQNNTLGGTTKITDNSTLATTGQKVIKDNLGLVVPPATQFPNLLIPLTTVTQAGISVFIPAGVRAGTKVRIICHVTNAATAQTLTPTLKFGTNNSNADANVAGLGLGAGTAAVGGGKITAEIIFTSATTAIASVHTLNSVVAAAGTGVVGLTNLPSQLSMGGGATPGVVTIATAANSWLGLYLSSATASAVTVRTVEYEVTQQ